MEEVFNPFLPRRLRGRPKSIASREGDHLMRDIYRIKVPTHMPHGLNISALRKDTRPIIESPDLLLIAFERTTSLSRSLGVSL